MKIYYIKPSENLCKEDKIENNLNKLEDVLFLTMGALFILLIV